MPNLHKRPDQPAASPMESCDTVSAGVALPREHPLVTIAWIVAAIVIAAGLGPWLSKCVGVALPAFAMVRTRRYPHRV